MTKDKYVSGNRDITYIVDRFNDYINLKDLIDWVASDDPRTKTIPNVNEKIDYIPARKFILPVDSALVLANGTVRPEMANKIVKEMRWELSPSKRYLIKNHLMILDMLATNKWERPIYYAITVSDDNYLNLEKYFQIQGLAFRIIPVESQGNIYGRGGIDTKTMFENFVNTFKWGGIEDPGVYIDENVNGMMTNFRNNFGRLAQELINENKKDSARIVLDKCIQILPDRVLPFNIFSLSIMDGYMKLGDTIQAMSICSKIKDNLFNDLEYYVSLGKSYDNYLTYEKQVAFYVLDELRRQAYMYNQTDLLAEMEEKMQYYGTALNIQMQ